MLALPQSQTTKKTNENKQDNAGNNSLIEPGTEVITYNILLNCNVVGFAGVVVVNPYLSKAAFRTLLLQLVLDILRHPALH
jgi:hypothetical protein